MNQITLTVNLDDELSIDKALDTLEALANAAENFKPTRHNNELHKGYKSGAGSVEIVTSDNLESLDMANVGPGAPGVDLESETTPIPTSGNIQMVNPGGVDLDAEGLPHDPRIHGVSRLKLKKEGTWKKIKNISTNKPGLVEQVEAELRAALTATPAVGTQPAETAAAAPPPPAETVDAAPPPPAETAAAAPPPPVEPEVVKYLHGGKEWTEKQLLAAKWLPAQIAALEVVETKTSNEPMTIADLMEKVPTALVEGTITQEDVDAALAKEGLANMPALYTRPDLIPAIDTALFG